MSIVYNLDVRCHEMLKYLLYQDGYTSITQLAEEMNISKRSVYYDIRKINEWMEAQHLSELVVERKKGIRIDDEQKAMIRAGLKMIPSELAYVFTPTERVKIIICSILQRRIIMCGENSEGWHTGEPWGFVLSFWQRYRG